jgi:hypothetical protein
LSALMVSNASECDVMNQTFSELQAAHQAALAVIDHARELEKERAAGIVSAAEATHASARDAELRDHAETHQQRAQTFQRYAAEAFLEPVKAYVTNPSRPAIAAIGAALRAVEAEGENAIGQPLDGPRGVGQELLHAIAAIKAEASPESAARLSWQENYNIAGTGTNYGQAVRGLRAGNLVEAGLHLASTEVGIEVIARDGRAGAGDGAKRWEIFRYGGTLGATNAALLVEEKAVDRIHGSAADRQLASSAMEQATTRRQDGESVLAAFDRIKGEMMLRIKQAAAELVTPPPPASPPRKPKARGEVDADAADDVKPPQFAGFV